MRKWKKRGEEENSGEKKGDNIGRKREKKGRKKR